MNLGVFSVSLNVKDIKASKEFYEKLGFMVIQGKLKQNWLIMRNGSCTIGLFQGMFENNILTFNPGWDENGKKLDSFMDVRDIQKKLKSESVTFKTEADELSEGPSHCVMTDPDGNTIMLDQHV